MNWKWFGSDSDLVKGTGGTEVTHWVLQSRSPTSLWAKNWIQGVPKCDWGVLKASVCPVTVLQYCCMSCKCRRFQYFLMKILRFTYKEKFRILKQYSPQSEIWIFRVGIIYGTSLTGMNCMKTGSVTGTLYYIVSVNLYSTFRFSWPILVKLGIEGPNAFPLSRCHPCERRCGESHII